MKSESRWTVRDLVYIGLFGALWGALEMTLGDLLHTLNVPFTGTILTALGIGIALIGRRFVPRRGSVLMIALITGLLKFLSPSGASVLRVFISILIEGAIAEGVLALLPETLATWMLADALASFWTLLHPVVVTGFLLGGDAAALFISTVENGAHTLGLSSDAVVLVLLLLALIRLILGALGGLLSWGVGSVVLARLRPHEEQA